MSRTEIKNRRSEHLWRKQAENGPNEENEVSKYGGEKDFGFWICDFGFKAGVAGSERREPDLAFVDWRQSQTSIEGESHGRSAAGGRGWTNGKPRHASL